MAEQNSDIIFPEYIHLDKPFDKAPEWIKLKIAVHPVKFAKWCEQYASPKGFTYFELRKSKKGEYYMCLDQYRHQAVLDKGDQPPKVANTRGAVEDVDPAVELSGEDTINPDDIPF